MKDYSEMSTQQLEQLSSQFQQEEYQILKELLRRNQDGAMINSNDVQAADMRNTEDDFS
jgi:hypothetical protein